MTFIRRKNIVWVCPGFAADEADSQCIPPLQLLAKELAKNKAIHLHIIALHYPFKTSAFDWHGIKVYPCFQKGSLSRLRIWTKAMQIIRQLHQIQPIDGLHSFWLTDAALLAHWSSYLLKIPHWVTLTGQDVRPSNRYLNLFPISKMNTIALSSFQAKVWEKTTGLEARLLIPWGIPFLNKKSCLSERPIDLLGVGNLISLKNYSLFIDMVKKLKNKRPQINALIIGDGKERDFLQKKIESEGLTHHIRLTGALPRNEVMGCMQKSKVLFHPSTYESYGFIFVEALAHGLHLVSRPVGIAQSSAKWWIGNTSDELFAHLLEALDTFKNPVPAYPYPISKTLEGYLRLYEGF